MGKTVAQEILFCFLKESLEFKRALKVIEESLSVLTREGLKCSIGSGGFGKTKTNFPERLHNHLKMLTYQTGLNSGFLIMNVSPSPFFKVSIY